MIAIERTAYPRFTHGMRNELAEELIVVGEARAIQNRTGSREEWAKAARGGRETGSSGEEGRSRREKRA